MKESSAVELIEAVSEFLKEKVLPEVEGFTAYNTRVAANSLLIAARQAAGQSEVDEMDRVFAESVGITGAGEDSARQISLQLKDGTLKADDALVAYLKQRTLKRLEIDNPRYWGYVEANKNWR